MVLSIFKSIPTACVLLKLSPLFTVSCDKWSLYIPFLQADVQWLGWEIHQKFVYSVKEAYGQFVIIHNWKLIHFLEYKILIYMLLVLEGEQWKPLLFLYTLVKYHLSVHKDSIYVFYLEIYTFPIVFICDDNLIHSNIKFD